MNINIYIDMIRIDQILWDIMGIHGFGLVCSGMS